MSDVFAFVAEFATRGIYTATYHIALWCYLPAPVCFSAGVMFLDGHQVLSEITLLQDQN